MISPNFVRLRLEEVGILLRRPVIGTCADLGHLFLDVIALQEHLDLLVERVEDRGGDVLRQENAEPG